VSVEDTAGVRLTDSERSEQPRAGGRPPFGPVLLSSLPLREWKLNCFVHCVLSTGKLPVASCTYSYNR
jgi:hypothetical protein